MLLGCPLRARGAHPERRSLPLPVRGLLQEGENNKMNWKYEIIRVIIFYLIGGIGFFFIFEASIFDWEYWLIALPLVNIAYFTVVWLAQKEEREAIR